MVSKATIESEDESSEDKDNDEDNESTPVQAVPWVEEPPAGLSSMEQAVWSLAASVKDLAEAQVRMMQILKKELKSLRVMSQGQEDALWDMGGEVGKCAVMLELFTRGERFLRIGEMGPPEEVGREVGVRHRKSKEVGDSCI